ncbi:histone h2a deubiquitinase mysm1 [Stylonychia lemnae]|uniref:Histone h2a deubiquitinase mysm1 n=1 Tax=Stylonychia lemnae TaxID=5949 RepID=A0A078AQE9_STYLE|nr:histone h2a deubiquitinase mysm1 [Stylonychia lemnae]|eukprot:CDW84650.1 histone h2a deubiquitinase mysm1 [Stylonychia lemnae]
MTDILIKKQEENSDSSTNEFGSIKNESNIVVKQDDSCKNQADQESEAIAEAEVEMQEEDSEIVSVWKESQYTTSDSGSDSNTSSQISIKTREADSTIDTSEKCGDNDIQSLHLPIGIKHQAIPNLSTSPGVFNLANPNEIISQNSTHSTSSATPMKPLFSGQGYDEPACNQFVPFNEDTFNECKESVMRIRELWKLQNQKTILDLSAANLYFHNRDPSTIIDPYSSEILIEVQKPMKIDAKIKTTKAELKRQEKERKQKEKERKVMQLDKNQDYYNPKEGEEPWWHVLNKEKFPDLLNFYKYPLQKMLSIEQIQSMRKMLGQSNPEQRHYSSEAKEKAYVRNETKKQQERNKALQARDTRPRRQAAQNASIQMNLSAKDPDDSMRASNQHELVECQRYLTEMHQPIVLFITLEALITMTCHASMHRNEVIGFVTGFRVKTKKTNKDIYIISETVTVQALLDDYGRVDYSKNVEMHPEHSMTRVQEIQQKGMHILGWYHSHPKFEVNPSHIDVDNHNAYQKMFQQEGQSFLGLIISPYYSTPDVNSKQNCLPKIRSFVNLVSKDNGSTLPYEIAINILPQTRLYKDYLLQQVDEIRENPFAFDKINLKGEACVIKEKKNNQIHMKKGEKLIRSIKQLIEINAAKIRKEKISSAFIAKHLEGLTILRNKVELPGQIERFDDKTDQNVLDRFKKELRKRGRYKRVGHGESEVDQEEDDESARGESTNQQIDEEDHNLMEEMNKKDWFQSINLKQVTWNDEVHQNLSLTIARINTEFFRKKGNINDYCINITIMGQVERFLEKLRETLEIDEDTYFSEQE